MGKVFIIGSYSQECKFETDEFAAIDKLFLKSSVYIFCC